MSVNSLNRVRSISTCSGWAVLSAQQDVSIPLIGYAPFLRRGGWMTGNSISQGVNSLNRVRSISTLRDMPRPYCKIRVSIPLIGYAPFLRVSLIHKIEILRAVSIPLIGYAPFLP